MHIGIAGAGLLGRLLAWRLSAAGHQIDLFDQDFSAGKSAAFTAAGMLTPCTESIISQGSIFDLGMRGLSLWSDIIRELDDNIALNMGGTIITCHSNDAPELDHFIQRLAVKLDAAQIKILDRDSIKKLEPDLDMHQGFYLKCEGYLDNRHVLRTLLSRAISQGVKTIEASITETRPGCIKTTDKQYSYDWIFDCRGIGAKQHFKDIRAVRGEVIRLHAPDVDLHHMVRLMHPRYPLYIVPQGNHDYVIGATEIESDDLSNISVRSCMELLNAAYSIHTGFAEARLMETRTALRPTLPDNLPRIIQEDGFTAINGLYRHGFLIAPALVQQSLVALNEEVL